MKKFSFILTGIITSLIAVTLIVMIILCFMDKKDSCGFFAFCFICLTLIDVFSICGLIEKTFDEREQKMKLLEKASFENEKKINCEKEEAYKTFCNTLVDL